MFKIADDQGLLLLDLKDLRAMLQHVGDNAKDYTTSYGNISAASVGAIARGLLQLESQGGTQFFGEPMLNIDDFMQTDSQGHGLVNVLAADKLLNSPRLYATFLLWMLSEVFERLPEVGDLEKPKLVFFFDEAHLLFNEAPKVLVERIELVVRLVRSKGVGVYFVTPTACWRSWATGCSMPCAPSPRATRRRSRPPPRPCAPSLASISSRPSASWA